MTSAAQIAEDLEAARLALTEAGAAVTQAEADYQAALTAEALGGEPGSSLVAKDRVTDAAHAKELAAARVRALEGALDDTEAAENRARCVEIAEELRGLDERTQDVGGEVVQTIETLCRSLQTLDELNNAAATLAGETERLATVTPGCPKLHSVRREVGLGVIARTRLTRLCERRTGGRDGYAHLRIA